MFVIITRPTVRKQFFYDAFITTNESQLHRNRPYAFYTFVIRPPIINGFLSRPNRTATNFSTHCDPKILRIMNETNNP